MVDIPIKLSAMCIEGKYELARLQAEEIYEQSQQLLESCQTQLAQTSNRELAKHATAICADFFLTGQVLGLVKKACVRAAPVLIGAVEFLREEREVEYVVATAEGPLVPLSEKARHVGGAAKGVAHKIIDAVNQTSEAILKEGYYEINGFKFSKFYYNKLWQNGRGTPSLAAKAILDNATKIIAAEISGKHASMA